MKIKLNTYFLLFEKKEAYIQVWQTQPQILMQRLHSSLPLFAMGEDMVVDDFSGRVLWLSPWLIMSASNFFLLSFLFLQLIREYDIYCYQQQEPQVLASGLPLLIFLQILLSTQLGCGAHSFHYFQQFKEETVM